MEKSPKISVFWAKIQKNFLTQGLISLTKYWNSVTVGSPAYVQKRHNLCIEVINLIHKPIDMMYSSSTFCCWNQYIPSKIRSMHWLLMPWLLVSPGHQHPWHWTCRINWCLFSTRKNQDYWFTICGLGCHILNWVNFGSRNGLLPDSTKLLPEPMLTLHQLRPVACIWGYDHKKILTYQWVSQEWKSHFWNLIQISQGTVS